MRQNSHNPPTCFGHFIVDIDECFLDLDNCGNNTQCINTDGSFICKCNVGYIGNGVVCNGTLIIFLLFYLVANYSSLTNIYQ